MDKVVLKQDVGLDWSLTNVTIGDSYGTIYQQTRFVKLWLMIEEERKKFTEARQKV